MYLHRKLHKIREKPDHVKEQIVVVCMIIAVPIILSVWFIGADFSAFKMSDAKDFFANSKTYFSNSGAYVFDSTIPENVFKTAQANASSTTAKTLVATTTSKKSSYDF